MHKHKIFEVNNFFLILIIKIPYFIHNIVINVDGLSINSR